MIVMAASMYFAYTHRNAIPNSGNSDFHNGCSHIYDLINKQNQKSAYGPQLRPAIKYNE